MGPSPRLRIPGVLACLLALGGCVESGQEGLLPVGGGQATDAERARFVRQLHLDVVGEAPDEAILADGVAALADAGDAVAVRQELVAALWAREDAAVHWTESLESRLFPGVRPAEVYAMQCGNARFGDPACREACGDTPPGGDPCACDGCEPLRLLQADRAALAETPARLADGEPTATLERRYAESMLYLVGRVSPEAVVTSLFEDFLARPPEPEELEQATRIGVGGIGEVSGVLFQRHGGSYQDLVAIVFESEPYAEAVVRRVFRRYLGREPTGQELVFFTAELPRGPAVDAQGLIRDVLASQEYFAR